MKAILAGDLCRSEMMEYLIRQKLLELKDYFLYLSDYDPRETKSK